MPANERVTVTLPAEGWHPRSLGSRRGLGGGEEVRLVRGTVILLDPDPTVGHEQRGVRPCIVVSDPDVVSDQRFPLLCVVPVTGTPGEGALYPSLSPGKSGLTKASYALIDHLRSVDKRRVQRVFGQLASRELGAIDEGLALFLGLGDRLEPTPTSGVQ